MKRHVLITAPIPDTLLERIASVSPDLVVERDTLPRDGRPEGLLSEVEIHYTTDRTLPPEQSPRLRWVQGHWAGVNNLVDTPVWNSDVLLTTTSGIHAPNIGQYVVAQLLAWANRVPRWVRVQQGGQWPAGRRDAFLPDELAGRTLGIIGYGSIGREVARLARAFNMTILVTKRDARRVADTGYTLPGFGDPAGELPTRIYPAEALRSVVGQCDYIVITLPLTPRTRHLFDESLFQTMRPNAYVVNVGRGPVIDEQALIKALQRGWIAGAGLDVFEKEPLPEDSPLWGMQNVILTPHVSGMTTQYDERAVDLFIANLRRYLAGETLFNVVDRDAGY